jgi:hypothetical protein
MPPRPYPPDAILACRYEPDPEEIEIEFGWLLVQARREAGLRRTSQAEVLRAWMGEDHEIDFDDHDLDDDAPLQDIAPKTELLILGCASERRIRPMFTAWCPACFEEIGCPHRRDCRNPRIKHRNRTRNKVTLADTEQEPHHHRVCWACGRTQAEWTKHNHTCQHCGASPKATPASDWQI